MVALPFCHVTLSGSKPKNPAYPAELNTIGDHLRKRRLDFGLLQKQVAERIGVTTCMIMYWETNRVATALRFLPKIIQFLGYDPCAGRKPQSLADKTKARRRKLGLSQRKVADLLGVDATTLAGWERGEHRPTEKSLKLISMFLRPVAGGSD